MIRLFLCGDVMPGRGIDQILPHPGDPALYEQYVSSAADYVALAERRNGPIPKPVGYDYVWGEALDELERQKPAARVVNLETAITTSSAYEQKGINYRMNPANIQVLRAASIDCCALANNHVLDWGEVGLEETLATLDGACIRRAGAGRCVAEAQTPAQIPIGQSRRLLLFACGCESSGIPRSWAAAKQTPGVNVLPDLSETTVADIARNMAMVRRAGDLLIASIHWGANWSYQIPAGQRAFAHRLIDTAGFHVVHGHSSHHAKALEVYRGRLILYGCGDFITDYEGISGYETFRGDLSVMYLPELSPAGTLRGLEMHIYQMRKFRLERASPDDTLWLQQRLDQESARFGVRVEAVSGNTLRIARAVTAES